MEQSIQGSVNYEAPAPDAYRLDPMGFDQGPHGGVPDTKELAGDLYRHGEGLHPSYFVVGKSGAAEAHLRFLSNKPRCGGLADTDD
jgi:hypothetical protein